MSRKPDAPALREVEVLRQHFLCQARTLLFSDPQMAAECREKAIFLHRLAREARSRKRGA